MFLWGFASLLTVWLLMWGLLESPNVLCFWVLLELLTLCGVPLFFVWKRCVFSSSALFYYFVGAAVSSFFLILGVLMAPFYNLFLVVSLLIKLGIFPFMGWVYRVCGDSNWCLIWFFSGLLKIGFALVLFGGGVSSELGFVVDCLAILSLLLAGLNFWLSSVSWSYVWTHMLISSSASLLVVSYHGGVYFGFSVYVCYLIWMSCAVLFFSFNPFEGFFSGVVYSFFYVFIFVALPCSLAVLYKVVVGLSLVGLPWVIFFSWGVYSVLEQLYLFQCFLSLQNVRGFLFFEGWV